MFMTDLIPYLININININLKDKCNMRLYKHDKSQGVDMNTVYICKQMLSSALSALTIYTYLLTYGPTYCMEWPFLIEMLPIGY